MTSRRKFISQASSSMLGLTFLSKIDFEHSYGNPSSIIESAESQGVSSKALIDLLKAADASGLEWHSILIQRRGKVITEAYWKPFEVNMKHTLYSLSKSFTSTAVGMCVDDGKLNVEDQVITFFPDELPAEISENLKNLKVKHLLTMNVGHQTEPNVRAQTNQSWIKTFLSHPIEHTPGTHFLYNTPATYVLGAIVQKISGKTLEEFLKPRLFDKLKITNYDWEKSPQGLNTAGYGLRVSTRDIANFGQLYLQKGLWKGERLLSEKWIDAATSKQTESQDGDSDWSQGYGYQFWRCKPAPGFYRGDGAYGQYCIVIPQYEMVIAVTSESWDMGKSMKIIWDNLLPNIFDKPLPANEIAQAELKALSKSLNIKPTKGLKNSPNAIKYLNKTYSFSKNDYGVDKLKLSIVNGVGTLSITVDNKINISKFGIESWQESFANNLFPIANRIHVPSKIASSGTWKNDNKLEISRKFIEAIHGDTLIFDFSDAGLTLSFSNSVSSNTNRGPELRPSIDGK